MRRRRWQGALVRLVGMQGLQGREQEGFGRRGGIGDLKELASEHSPSELVGVTSSSDYSYAPIAATATDWFCEAPSADWSASGHDATAFSCA